MNGCVLLGIGNALFFVAWLVTLGAALEWRANALEAKRLLDKTLNSYRQLIDDFGIALRS